MCRVESRRAFVVHLRAAHRQLSRHVDVIEQALTLRDQAACTALSEEVIHRLHSLRDELQMHFDEEESGGCMEEAVCGQPKLSHAVTRLEHEHPELLLQIDWIIDVAQAGVAELASQEFERFVPRLRAHATAENRILAAGFDLEMVEVI